MTAPARIKKSDISTVMRSAREAGYIHVRIKIMPDGTLDVIASDAAPADEGDWRKNQPLYRDH